MSAKPGSLVSYREREWVVLPSEDPNLVVLRPIGGSPREVCGVWKPLADLMAYALSFERITPAQFPLPEPTAVQDHAAVGLLLQAARLLLREGAAPFSSLGRLSIRPRPYQFVPLLMALRLETVRLLIADDVGVGKTIEAALVARELLDRGDVRRLAVLCPPYLCDQWRKELLEKFHIEAEVIRSGTVSRLERQAPPDKSIFQHFRHFVASMDLVKGDRFRAAFLQHCPELVVIDEVHGAVQPPGDRRARAQQQRHELLQDLAARPDRHLVLLTATPHSGIEDSFLSILGLLKPEFRRLNLSRLTEPERIRLARHFIQRRRADVKHWMGQETPFPERDDEGTEQPYSFSREYKSFYQSVYNFASDIVQSAETLTGWKRRMRFYSALALLRCVTSSPAAAAAALVKRARGEDGASGLEFDTLDTAIEDHLATAFEPVVYDPLEAEAVVDAPPSSVFDTQEQDPDWLESDRRRLRQFARVAQGLRGDADNKLVKLVSEVADLLRHGFHPIVWCRYIATADYVAEELQHRLQGRFPLLRVVSVTGAISEDERRLKVDDLITSPRRVLVATDCLSEGINLQEHFSAVVHYDLPWNPNRLEQREGRVDRFGQPAPKVKAVMIFGQDNPVDGAVLDVLLRKAREIHRSLGVHVPVPIDSETVMETVMRSLFARARHEGTQMRLFDESDEAGRMVRLVHDRWAQAVDREQESRTRFAQRAIKPEEVARELNETDTVLGDPDDVRRFLQEVSQRLGFGFRPVRDGIWDVQVSGLPPAVRQRLGAVPESWRITFDSPTPEGAVYVGRNHPLIEALAEYLLDLAFHPSDSHPPAARCGVIRTAQVSRRTTLLLLRLRYLVYERGDETPNLAEETLVWGFQGVWPDLTPLPPDQAQQMLDAAQAAANVPLAERQEVLAETLSWWPDLQPKLGEVLDERARQLQESHQRIRSLLSRKPVRIEPQTPPDLLGVVVLLPVPKGVRP
jgi:superfamily II DNA or RNA helicase